MFWNATLAQAKDPSIEIVCYKSGYKGLLLGDSVTVTEQMRAQAADLQMHGGSPIGNSRVKLTNVADCVKRGLVKEGESPLECACKQLEKDQITILHTVGGDDTNTQAAELAKFLLEESAYKLCVVGLPKTIDNDVFPIRQSLGAYTAAEHGAAYFANVVNELSANPRMLILHEVMGRDCGWLTAYTAKIYREEKLSQLNWVEGFSGTPVRRNKDVHAVYIPEMQIDIDSESARYGTTSSSQSARSVRILSDMLPHLLGPTIACIRARLEACFSLARSVCRTALRRSWIRTTAATSSSQRVPALRALLQRWRRVAKTFLAMRLGTSSWTRSIPAHGLPNSLLRR